MQKERKTKKAATLVLETILTLKRTTKTINAKENKILVMRKISDNLLKIPNEL